VIVNLLDNARKYSPEGQPIEVTLAQPTADHIVISVRDHGNGILEVDRPYIFERFYQASPSRSTAGLGLGLFISRQIVELHGGELTVEFPEDGGTRFVARLPTRPPRSDGVAGLAEFHHD
jgi:signal transduction histidine kinase